MAEPSISQDLYDRLIVINKEAYNAQLFDAAYHALASALHCTQDLELDQPLADVAKLAKEQLSEIDQQHPEYEHSTRSASERNHESIFFTLSRQAETLIRIRQHNREREKGS